MAAGHSMLRLDATTKKRYVIWKTLHIQKNSIKQAFFINEIFSACVKVATQKKLLKREKTLNKQRKKNLNFFCV